jgi:dsDNA-specific endonuclease/ATPase MutS2
VNRLIEERQQRAEELREAQAEAASSISKVERLTEHFRQSEADIRQKSESALAEARAKYESLLETVLKYISPSTTSVNESIVIAALQKVSITLEQPSLIKSPPRNRTEISGEAREWKKWARDLFARVSDGEVAAKADTDLRFVIGEMVLASISHRSIVGKLESLRLQKKFLTSGAVAPNSGGGGIQVRSLVDVVVTVVSIVRILKKGGVYPVSPPPSTEEPLDE